MTNKDKEKDTKIKSKKKSKLLIVQNDQEKRKKILCEMQASATSCTSCSVELRYVL